jgi:hypothetical protein
LGELFFPINSKFKQFLFLATKQKPYEKVYHIGKRFAIRPEDLFLKIKGVFTDLWELWQTTTNECSERSDVILGQSLHFIFAAVLPK